MYDGKRFQKSTKQGNLNAAKDIESAFRTKLAKEEVGIKDKKSERLTVAMLLERRLEDLEERGKGDYRNQSLNKYTKKDFGAKWADELTKADLDKYIKDCRAKGLAFATIMNRIGELASAFLLAGMKPPRPRKLTKKEKNNTRRGFFSKSEFESVCEQLPEDLRDFCRFGYVTGMRFGSITKICWADIEDGEMNLPAEDQKTYEELKLPIEGELAEVIARRERLKIVETENGTEISALVFHREGKPVLPFRRTWIKACIAAGQGRMLCPFCSQESIEYVAEQKCSHCRKPMTYEGRLFHDFRRSAARDMIRAGVAQTVAMAITGHKTVSMFQRYNISDTSDLRDALRKTALHREAGQRKVRSIAAQR